MYFHTYSWLSIKFRNISFTIRVPFLDLECFSLYQATKGFFDFIRRIFDHKDAICYWLIGYFFKMGDLDWWNRFNFKQHYLLLVDSWNYMLLILAPSFAKRIGTRILLTARLNERKNFVLRSCVVDMKLPSKQLPVQSYRPNQKSKVWKLLSDKEWRH